jgi:hypothetical protein
MNVQYLPQWFLIAAREIPRDRSITRASAFKDDLVALDYLIRGEHPAQWIIDMYVGARLIQNEIEGIKPGDDFPEALEVRTRLARLMKPSTESRVRDRPRQAESLQDSVRPIAIVHVAVQDHHPLYVTGNQAAYFS